MAVRSFVLRAPDGMMHTVSGPTLVIGRDPASGLVLCDPQASRCHATLLAADGRLAVRDEASTNGTYVNGRRVVGTTTLSASDALRIGSQTFLVELSVSASVPGAASQRRAANSPSSTPAWRTPLLSAGGILIALAALLFIITSASSPDRVRSTVVTTAPGVEVPRVATASRPVTTTALPARPPSTAPANDWVATFERVAPDIVAINNMADQRRGTGFSFDAHYVITNAHVLGNADSVEVMPFDAAGTIAGASTPGALRALRVAVDSEADLALLRLDQPRGTGLPIGSTRDVRIGDEVMAIGDPRGLTGTATFGRVGGIRRGSDLRKPGMDSVIQFDAPVNPGNSGGPLIAHDGSVVGIVTFMIPEAHGLGFALGPDQIAAFANRYASTE